MRRAPEKFSCARAEISENMAWMRSKRSWMRVPKYCTTMLATGSGRKAHKVSLGLIRDHEDERAGGEDERVGRIHDGRAEQHAHGVQVVGGARHDVAGAGALVEAGVEGFEMAEEIVAQVELDLARDADHDPAGEELKDAFAYGDGNQQPAPGEQFPVSDTAVQIVNDALDEARGLHHDSVGAEDREGAGHKTLPVLFHVWEERPELGKCQGKSPIKRECDIDAIVAAVVAGEGLPSNRRAHRWIAGGLSLAIVRVRTEKHAGTTPERAQS